MTTSECVGGTRMTRMRGNADLKLIKLWFKIRVNPR